jgi:hypothetical protein
MWDQIEQVLVEAVEQGIQLSPIIERHNVKLVA